MDLRKLDGLLKETGGRRGAGPSLTSQIVEVLHTLAKDSPDGVSARAVVQEFVQNRDDVNESTIRSTLYQVTRKIRPTEIGVGDEVQRVRVIKKGPLYDVVLVSEQEAEFV
jgi:Fe2+ or Zn2+ uptake regulation protein